MNKESLEERTRIFIEEFERQMEEEVNLARRHMMGEIKLDDDLRVYLIGVMSTYNTVRKLLYELFQELKTKEKSEKEDVSY